jgi:hypothetical protein
MNARRIQYVTVAAIAFAAIISVFLPACATAQTDKPEGIGLAYISYLTGDVLFSTADSDEWGAAAPNYALMEGDRLWAGEDSKLEVRFESGETAWLNYQSELDFLKLEKDDDGTAYQMALPAGEASFDVKNFEALKSVFQVDTPNTSVRAYGRARFRVTSLADGTTQAGVTDGSVEVESEEGVANVYSGEMLEVYPDGRSRIMGLPRADSWDDWVASRLDRRSKAARSARYLPRDMYGYADEFDEGGRWESYPEYGYVWVPAVAAGWSPYSNGRWVYYGFDYVWLPYDPWYAPFHYGRWNWTVSFGWCWVPPAPGAFYWSPGYVGWTWGPDYVYWVPLAPSEVYYGYGYYGPTSVNIYTTTVIVNKNVYINTRAANGVVAMHRHDFSEGRMRRAEVKRERIREAFSGRERVAGGSPAREFKHAREARLPRPDVRVSERQLPPRQITERRGEVRDRRVVRGEVKSAFDPGRQPRHMRELERVRQPEFKRQGREVRPGETRPETRPQIHPEMRPETRPEARPERRPDTRPDVRPKKKPETRPQVHPEMRPESRPEARPERRPDARPDVRPEKKPETRPQVHPEMRPERRPEPRTEPGNVTVPQTKPQRPERPAPDARPERKPEPRIEPGNVTVPQAKPGRPETRPERGQTSREKGKDGKDNPDGDEAAEPEAPGPEKK